jgi:hypothetical protein
VRYLRIGRQVFIANHPVAFYRHYLTYVTGTVLCYQYILNLFFDTPPNILVLGNYPVISAAPELQI